MFSIFYGKLLGISKFGPVPFLVQRYCHGDCADSHRPRQRTPPYFIYTYYPFHKFTITKNRLPC
jgi:hypothetical protein